MSGDRPDAESVAYAGVAGQAELLRSGAITAVELVSLLLERIVRFEPTLNAFRLVLGEEALAAAAAADAARRDGDPRELLGVPIALKDNIALVDTASRYGTGSPEPTAAADDELVRRIRAAGMIIIGKTHMPELAMWAATESRHHGISRNPWDLSYVPGGSSGGSAAAVAAGLVPAAHATDGLGSIRIPASCCGLVGLKPTRDLLPAAPHWHGMSHAGFVTRSVRDTALLIDNLAEGSPRLVEAIAAAPASLRIATSLKGASPARAHPEIRAAHQRVATILADLGHTLVERDPPYGAALATANSLRYLGGVAQDLAALADPHATERRTRELAALGRRIPARAITWARTTGDDFGARMAAFFDDVDLLMTPTMPVLPRRAGELSRRGALRTLPLMLPCAAYTGAWNAAGLPAMSVPAATTAGGLPIGVQLIGPSGGEDLLVGVAAALESVIGWTDRRVVSPEAPARLA
ncbi:MAG TPA: amidase family protein [Mycobacteriales bacterium]|nr:amidase family protein [Mycobacteriales bacterium]